MRPIALSAALAVKNRLGPRAGLAALRPVILQLGEGRGEAMLAALECARQLGDREEYARLTTLWSATERVDLFTALAQEVIDAAPHAHDLALALAEAETRRTPQDARAFYLLGRLGDEDALRTALRLAQRPPRQESLIAATIAAMAAAGMQTPRVPSAPEDSTPEFRLAVAAAALRHRAGYRRVAALDALIEIAEQSDADDAIWNDAHALVADFVRRKQPSPIEWDRVRTLLRQHPRAAAAFECMALIRQARGQEQPTHAYLAAAARVAGGTEAGELEGGDSAAGPFAHAWPALRAIENLRGGQPVQWQGLEQAAEPALVVCALGLGDPAHAEPAAALGHRLVLGAPTARFGWLRAADAAARSEFHELAALLRGRALAVDEPGARAAQGEDERRLAWDAFDSGDMPQATRLLTRARRVLRED